MGIVKVHPYKGTHRVAYINENYFDSIGCAPPKNFLKFLQNEKDIV